MQDYSKLQNGSDIRGIVLPGPDGQKPNLGREATYRITRGFLLWLSSKTGKDFTDLKVAIGHDSRITAVELKEAIIDTARGAGVVPVDCGLASTPAMFMSTIFPEFDCDGAVMITASHLPFNRNGFKYFTKDGGLNKEDITEILAYADSDNVIQSEFPPLRGMPPKVISADLMQRYSDHLKQLIIDQVSAQVELEDKSRPLAGLKIMVDAGNGAGGFYATHVLEPLGADISASQFLEPDGNFPNHIPNPESKEAMASASAQVKASGADYGLVFDTDVDRFSAIDKDGNEINRDKIVAMASALIAREHPATTIVTDSITSPELTEYLENCLGLKHLRFKRGYRNVINKAIELNNSGIDSQLAIETSGHAAYQENYFLDDGAYLATKMVIKSAQLRHVGADISCLIEPLKMPAEDAEHRLPLENIPSGTSFSDVADKALEALADWDKIDGQSIALVTPNYEGVRLSFDIDASKATALGLSGPVTGWCLLRKSLHDPIMPLNIQTSKGATDDILLLIKDALADYI